MLPFVSGLQASDLLDFLRAVLTLVIPVIPCGHNACSECFARITDPSQAIADGNAEGHAEPKCPNCRGKISPLKVIDHKAFKQVYMPELLNNQDLIDNPEADIETTDGNDSEETTDDDEDSDDEELDSKGNLKGFIVDEDDLADNASETEDDGGDAYGPIESNAKRATTRKSKKRSKGKGKAKEPKAPRQTLAELKREGMRNAKARRKYLKRLNKDWIPSAKTEKTMELLRNIQERKDPVTKQCEKTIVFRYALKVHSMTVLTNMVILANSPLCWTSWRFQWPPRNGTTLVTMAPCQLVLGTTP